MKKYISEEVQQQAALQLHIEIENDCKIEFDNFRFQIDEEDMTVCRYAEQMYRRYLKLINGDINTNSECYCESLL